MTYYDSHSLIFFDYNYIIEKLYLERNSKLIETITGSHNYKGAAVAIDSDEIRCFVPLPCYWDDTSVITVEGFGITNIWTYSEGKDYISAIHKEPDGLYIIATQTNRFTRYYAYFFSCSIII